MFWNYRYGGPDKEELLARLIQAEAVDVVVLVETRIDPSILSYRLEEAGRPFSVPRVPHPDRAGVSEIRADTNKRWARFEVLAGYLSACFVDWARDEDRIRLRKFKVPGRVEILLGAIHLPSGLHLERSERKSAADSVARVVRQAQRDKSVGHERTILVGDFNLNPFDDGMIFPSGFGAMMTKGLVRKSRPSPGEFSGRFYNPTWSRLGREWPEAPPGTYYWRNNRELNTYWNWIDQVLVGADLLDHFSPDRLRILTSIPGPAGPRPLIRETPKHWSVEISDHLPLIFDVDLPPEETVNGR